MADTNRGRRYWRRLGLVVLMLGLAAAVHQVRVYRRAQLQQQKMLVLDTVALAIGASPTHLDDLPHGKERSMRYMAWSYAVQVGSLEQLRQDHDLDPAVDAIVAELIESASGIHAIHQQRIADESFEYTEQDKQEMDMYLANDFDTLERLARLRRL